MRTSLLNLCVCLAITSCSGVCTLCHAAALPERCMLVPVNGRCKAMIEKFFFDQQNQKCKAYFHDGCGPVVPFDTLDECRQLCEPQQTAPKKRASSGLYYDPVEDDPRYADVFKKINDEVNEALTEHPKKGSMGFVHIIWEMKKQILKQKYGINWKTPAELNPQVMFD